MAQQSDSGDRTQETVRGRFQAWREQNPAPRSPSALGFPEVSEGVEKALGMAVGFGAGALLLVLAATCLYAAGTWGAVERSGAQVAYAAAGFFLLISGGGAILATWNHAFRVLGRPPAHH